MHALSLGKYFKDFFKSNASIDEYKLQRICMGAVLDKKTSHNFKCGG